MAKIIRLEDGTEQIYPIGGMLVERVLGSGENMDTLSTYPSQNGYVIAHSFTTECGGTKPFSDGHLLTFVWRNVNSPLLAQLAIEDNRNTIMMRNYSYSRGNWSAWESVH